MRIYDINMSASENEIRDAYERALGYADDVGQMDMKIRKLQTTGSKNYYSLDIIHNNSNHTSLIMLENAGIYTMKKVKLGGVSNGFYSLESSDDESNHIMAHLLESLACKINGTVAFTTGNDFDVSPCIVKDGQLSAKSAVALIDDDGNVYGGPSNSKKASWDSGGLSINKNLGDYIKEEAVLNNAIKNAHCQSMQEAMDIVGKYLISQKMKDAITVDEFDDIFMQAGSVGFTDKTCQMLYKLRT